MHTSANFCTIILACIVALGGSAAEVAPVLTSPLLAHGTEASAFDLQLSASGSAPLNYAAAGLPEGLLLSGGRITGVPASAGTFQVSLSVSNNAGSDTQTLIIVIGPSADRRALGTLSGVATVTRTSANPFEYLRIDGSFVADAATSVQFVFGKTIVEVQPTLVTATSVRVGVPVALRGAKFKSGSAKVYVTQGSGAAASSAYAGKLKIANLPKVKLPPGVLTKSFIDMSRGILMDAQSRIQGTAQATPQNTTTLTETLAFLDSMSAAIGEANAAGATRSVRSRAGNYEVNVSESTLKEMDRYFAGVVAASANNTVDLTVSQAYLDWQAALQLGPGVKYDATKVAQILQAEQQVRTLTAQNAEQLTAAINATLAPTTSTVAALGLVARTTANPVALAAAAQLALCTDVLMSGLLFGLALDAGYYYLRGDTVQYQIYLQTAGNLTGDFATGKLLTSAIGAVGGAETGDLAGNLNDIVSASNASTAMLQNVAQPEIKAPTTSGTGGSGTGTGSGVTTFDGGYSGSYSGTATTSYGSQAVSGGVTLFVNNGVITVTSPGNGTGNVGSNGAAAFNGAGAADGASYSFTGTFATTGVASGTWNATFAGGTASGTWNATLVSVPGN